MRLALVSGENGADGLGCCDGSIVRPVLRWRVASGVFNLLGMNQVLVYHVRSRARLGNPVK